MPSFITAALAADVLVEEAAVSFLGDSFLLEGFAGGVDALTGASLGFTAEAAAIEAAAAGAGFLEEGFAGGVDPLTGASLEHTAAAAAAGGGAASFDGFASGLAEDAGMSQAAFEAANLEAGLSASGLALATAAEVGLLEAGIAGSGLLSAVSNFLTPANLGSFALKALGSFGTNLAVGLVLGGISRALGKKADSGNSGVATGTVFAAQGRNLSLRQPIAPWQVVMGQARVGGTITFAQLSSDKRYMHVVVTLACHEVNAIGDVILDAETITSGMLDSSGNVTSGAYYKADSIPRVEALTVPGSPYQVTLAHTPSSIEAVVGATVDPSGNVGQFVFQAVSGSPASMTEYSISGSTLTFHSAYTGGTATINYTESPALSILRIKKSLGAESAQPFPDLVAESEGKWTDAHRQTGHAKIYLRFDVSVLQSALPQISAVVQGLKPYDPRTGLSPYSANNALLVAAYLTNTEWGLGADVSTEIDADALSDAADICDEAVTLAAGGTEARYTANGTFLTSERPVDIVEKLLGSMAGRAAHVSDTWRIFAGAYEAPTVTLDEGELSGAIQIDPMPPREAWANAAKGVFIDPNNDWQPTDFPANAPAAYLSADENERIWADLDLTAFTTSSARAQRLAKIELLRRRNALTFTGQWQLSAWRAMTARTVSVNFARYGWAPKVFEVLESSFVVLSGESGPALGVNLTLRETSAAVYDWTTDEESDQDLSPNTNLPDAFTAPPPGVASFAEELVTIAGDRLVTNSLAISWAAPEAGYIAGYEARYKDATASDYTNLPPTTSTSVSVDGLPQAIYVVQVRTVNAFDARSNWTTAIVEVKALSEAPATPTNVSLQIAGGQALIKLDPHPSLNVQRGGRILVRHSESTSGATWEEGFSIGEAEGYPGASTQIAVPLKAGTYLVKARTADGLESASPATVTTKQASVLAFSTLTTVTEDTVFSGTHSGTVAIDGKLKLSAEGLFDDIPDFDACAELDDYGGVTSTGTYTFSAGVDLTTVKNVRVTGVIEGITVNVLDSIDDRTGNIDDWLDFDGTAGGGSCDAWLEARHTDDDPAGSPTWTSWLRLDAAEFAARGFQFRLKMISTDPAYNLLVDTLRARVEEVT